MLPRRLSVLLLIFLGFIVYFNALFNGFIVGDDEEQLLNHPQVHKITNIPQFFAGSTYYRAESERAYGLYYRPLMLTVYSLVYTVFGPDPLMFHAIQVGLHVLNAILIFSLFSLFLPEVWALVGAGMFLVHPINSEAVLHIANLQEVLFMTFGLTSLILIMRNKDTKWGLRGYVILGTSWLLSLFAKETGVLFIGLGVWWTWTRERKYFWKIGGIAMLVVFIYLGIRFGLAKMMWVSPPISAIARLNLGERLGHIPILGWNYLMTFFWPEKLSVFQIWIIKRFDIGNFYLPLMAIAVLFVGWWVVKKKIISTDKRRVYDFFSLWLLSGLFLHVQIIPLDATWAERWFYFPIVGLIGILILLVICLWVRLSNMRVVMGLIIVAVIFGFSGRTIARTGDWRSSEILLHHDYKLQGDNYYMENLLATLYIREKKYIEAKPYVEKSIQGYPNFGNLNNAAIIALYEKDYPLAWKYFQETLKLGQQYGVIVNYANALIYLMHDYKEAKAVTVKYLPEYPKGAELWLVNAQAEYGLGNVDAAILAAKEAYRLRPFVVSEEVLKAIEGKRKIEVEKYLEL